MEAIIKAGGHQYRVKEGDTIKVQKLDSEVGKEVKFDEVFLIKKDDSIAIGNPKVKNAYVEGIITEQGREKKIIIFFYKHKTRNRKKNGHRQPYTLVKIGKIVGGE